jgi:hypothetical protein
LSSSPSARLHRRPWLRLRQLHTSKQCHANELVKDPRRLSTRIRIPLSPTVREADGQVFCFFCTFFRPYFKVCSNFWKVGRRPAQTTTMSDSWITFGAGAAVGVVAGAAVATYLSRIADGKRIEARTAQVCCVCCRQSHCNHCMSELCPCCEVRAACLHVRLHVGQSVMR